ncbi:MAG: winged helix-turn-helix domain-containing protein [archaeon GBS-70-058]|nr:winged helix-turn-helix domain-containing protein [Candidatus Culexarchaeum nevadense]
MSKRRTKYDIYAEILETILRRGPSPITRIAYGAGLPVDRARRAIQFLLSKGLLKEEVIGDMKLYTLTKRGGEFLEALKVVRKYMS